MHGGKGPKAVANAERRMIARSAEADAYAVLAFEGLVGIEDPLEALSRLAQETAEFKNALARRVNALNQLHTTSSSAGAEQLRVEVGLYERALDRTGKFMEILVRSGFEERRTRVSEEQGRMLAGVITRILSQLLADVLDQVGDVAGLSGQIESRWNRSVGEVVPRELRAVAAEQARG